MTPREACRLFRHRWFVVSGDWTPRSSGHPLTQRCDRCDTEKREVIGVHTGQREGSPRYIYPPEYHYSRDEVPTGDELRLMWIREQIAQIRKDRKQA